MEAAILPEHLRFQPDPLLKDLPLNETCWITFTEMRVTSDYRCYLNPDASRRTYALNVIRVRRDAAGYHVIVLNDGTPYRFFRLEKAGMENDWIPVASIIVDPPVAESK
jgi:hypothetical protein